MNFEKLAKRKPLKILLAEDNKVNQILTLGLLRSLGYEADLVADGQLAVDAIAAADIEAKNYDLVLMDCQLPTLDGYAAARIIRSQLRTRPKLAAYTAHVSEKELARCREAGMEYILSKPLTLDALVQVISQAYDDILFQSSSRT